MAEDVQEPPWLDLTTAANRSGLAREAIRSRVRRGVIASRKGNDGRLLVQLPAAEPGHSRVIAGLEPGYSQVEADLLAEIAELRAAMAGLAAERDLAVAVGKAEVAAKAELVEELRLLLDHERRPWWRRWWG